MDTRRPALDCESLRVAVNRFRAKPAREAFTRNDTARFRNRLFDVVFLAFLHVGGGGSDMISAVDGFLLVGNHGHDDLRVTARISRRIGHARAIGDKRSRLFRRAIVDRQSMSSAEQVACHAHTHFAKPNESKIHNRKDSESSRQNQGVFQVRQGQEVSVRYRTFARYALITKIVTCVSGPKKTSTVVTVLR